MLELSGFHRSTYTVYSIINYSIIEQYKTVIKQHKTAFIRSDLTMTQQFEQKENRGQRPVTPGKSTDYRYLQPDQIFATIKLLERRIEERFPQAGLASVCRELLEISRISRETTLAISRPMWGLRVFVYLIIIAILAVSILVIRETQWNIAEFAIADLITLSEALFNDIILIGAAILSLFTIETRVKRHRTSTAIHRLRSLAHLVDVHQLTKDPEQFTSPGQYSETASSPDRSYTRFELSRYLDYSSEMLALIGKVGAMYVEYFPDTEAVSSVNELESLTTGLSQKIWQKIMILNTEAAGAAEK